MRSQENDPSQTPTRSEAVAKTRPRTRRPPNHARGRAPWGVLGLLLGCLLLLLIPLVRGETPFELGLDLAGGALVTYRPNFEDIPPDLVELPERELLALAKETLAGRLRLRFDTLPDVVVTGDERILVSLPGEHDQRRVLETLGQTYRLTFRQALATHDHPPDDPRGWLRPYEGRWLDLGEELLAGEMLDPRTIRAESSNGRSLAELGRGVGVGFEFRPPHDERFAEITRAAVGETLAILLDDRVEWAGRVDSEIRGPGILQGGYTFEEANEVASLLRSGNLPLALEVEGLSAVGPTLGREVFELGGRALLASLAMLATVFAVAYGRRPPWLLAGWTTLLVLGLTTLALIRGLGLTVDLVAIAGLVLSIGMGVDAFFLVAEAWNAEELRGAAKQSPLSRLRTIYGRRGEGRTLLHANGSTLLVISLLLGSDRLRSFALFLVVGLVASLLTLWVTRTALLTMARRGWLEAAAGASSRSRWPDPLGWLRRPRLELLRWRWLYVAALGLFLTVAGVTLAGRAPGEGLRLGSDFEPGIQMQVTLLEETSLDRLERTLRSEFPGHGVRTQAWSDSTGPADGRGALLTLEGISLGSSGSGAIGEGESRASPERLSAVLDSVGGRLEALYSIDPKLSARRVLGSLTVLVGSLVLLGLYLTWFQKRLDGWLGLGVARQDPRRSRRVFAGTVLAVILDLAVVLATLGLLGIPIGMPVVGALLTIVGYSVNDSVVLWSHLSRDSKGSAEGSVSRVVDRIVSRAVLTSCSTAVPALAILAVGLEPLRGFAWAVLVGSLSGTLSSLFVVAGFARQRPPRVSAVETTPGTASVEI